MRVKNEISRLVDQAYNEGVEAGKKSVLDSISKLLDNSPKDIVTKKVAVPRPQSSLSPAQKAVQTKNRNRVLGQKKWWDNATPEQRAARMSARWGEKTANVSS